MYIAIYITIYTTTIPLPSSIVVSGNSCNFLPKDLYLLSTCFKFS